MVLNNGKRKTLIFNANNENADMTTRIVRQVKAMMSFNQMRNKAQNSGFMSEEEINAEINEARKIDEI